MTRSSSTSAPEPSPPEPESRPPERPSHHRPEGGYRNPWPGGDVRGGRDALKWMAQRIKSGNAFRRDRPRFAMSTPGFERPRAPADMLTATWVGHSTVLLQLGTVTVLTDPIWSRRASPFPLLGPRRHVRAGVKLSELPAVDAVLVSHNHYDHLDAATVRRLNRRIPDLSWVSPLGLEPWLRKRGVRNAWELDWWDTLHVSGATVTAVPARHFSARGLDDRFATLWCGYVVEADGWRVLFCGDSAMHDDWRLIGERLGPFDAMLIPIGAYDPRWFMEAVHMNPEEAVATYGAVSAGSEPRGAPPAGKVTAARQPPVMLPIHWGTFKLTDEPLDEPPTRLRSAWEKASLDADSLWLMQHGETRRLRRGA